MAGAGHGTELWQNTSYLLSYYAAEEMMQTPDLRWQWQSPHQYIRPDKLSFCVSIIRFKYVAC